MSHNAKAGDRPLTMFHPRVSVIITAYNQERDLGFESQQHVELLLRRRIHDDNIGIRERDSRSDYVKLLKLALDRRRQITQSPPDDESSKSIQG